MDVKPRASDRVLKLLRAHGDHPSSFQVLEPGYQYWFDGDRGCVAYSDTGRAWVAAGQPVAARDALASVSQNFVTAAREAGRSVRYFAAEGGFTEAAGLARTHIGEQPVWIPGDWEQTLSASRSLREQLRRARAKGVRVSVPGKEEVMDESSPFRSEADGLIERWLASRKMSEMKFMVLVHPFSHARERRYMVARQGGQLVGLAVAVPIYGRNGWFVEDLLRDPSAANGTVETLVDAMMRSFAEEGAEYVTLGLAPLAGDVNAVLKFTRDYTSRLYNFGGVRAFKARLRPARWDPVYLAYPSGDHGLVAMRDALTAFAPGGLVRFGLNTLVHQRSLATAILALLLVPWTLMLASPVAISWFPTEWLRWSWVGFDVLLIGLMAHLVRRWQPRIATSLVVLTSADAVLTALQFALHNVSHLRGALEWGVACFGLTGPVLAASFFWATRLVSVRTRLSPGHR